MKCYNHNEVDAVAACLDCGKGLCPSCADAYERPYCERCATKINAEIAQKNFNLLYNNLSMHKKTAIKKIFGIIWNTVFMVIGIIAYIKTYQPDSAGTIATIIFFWGIAGLPWVFSSGIMRERHERIENDVVVVSIERSSPSLIGAIIKLIIGFIIGAIAAPILLVISIVILKISLSGIRESKKQLAEY